MTTNGIAFAKALYTPAEARRALYELLEPVAEEHRRDGQPADS